MSNSWDHLPNAQHIDRVLSDLSDHISHWGEAYALCYYMFNKNSIDWNAAWISTRESLKDRNLYDIWKDCQEHILNIVRDNSLPETSAIIAAESTILGLISNDNSSNFLDANEKHVKTMLLLGCSHLMLVYPGVLALKMSDKESE